MTTATVSRPGAGPADRFDALRTAIAGDVILPGDPDYDSARRVHDLSYDRWPRAIVRCATAEDVAAAILFARAEDLAIAVRSGGHSVAGYSVMDGALVIDLSAMRRVSIDPVRRTARVQPGVTSADLAGPAHAYGFALTTGDTSTVGIAGLALGGGIGWMVRKYGLSIDSLLAAELVTADGSKLRASPDEHPDLFWALRGGGGNFGIVTELEFRLAPVGSVYAGALVLPPTREVIRAALDYALSAPDELTVISQVMHAPPAPFIPAERVGELVFVLLVCYAGDAEEGARVVAPLRALADPIADTVTQIPYPLMYEYTQAAAEPHIAAVRSAYAYELPDRLLDDIVDHVDRATSPFSMVQVRPLGGAMARIPADATAFAHRDKPFLVAALGLWFDPAEDGDVHRAWTESVWRAIRPYGSGVYANFLGSEGDGRIREAYPTSTYARLATVKRRYDPDNVFQFNQNVRPA